MTTTRINLWEFIQDGPVLRYRMTAIGLIPGAVVIGFVAMTCMLCALKFYREATGAMGYVWCLVFLLLFPVCLYGLFHHMRSRVNPYRLDKRADVFTNGYKELCNVSDIADVRVNRVEGLVGLGGSIRHPYFNVDFVLQDGEHLASFITTENQDEAEQHAEVFERFLKTP